MTTIELARELLALAFMGVAPLLAVAGLTCALSAAIARRLGFQDVAVSALVRALAVVLALYVFGDRLVGETHEATRSAWAGLAEVGHGGAPGSGP